MANKSKWIRAREAKLRQLIPDGGLRDFSHMDTKVCMLGVSKSKEVKLDAGKQIIPIDIRLHESIHDSNPKSSFTIKDGKYELAMPVRKGKSSVILSPIEFSLPDGSEYLLSAKTSPAEFLHKILHKQRVALYLSKKNK